MQFFRARFPSDSTLDMIDLRATALAAKSLLAAISAVAALDLDDLNGVTDADNANR